MSTSNPNFDEKPKLAYRLGEFAELCSVSPDFLRAEILAGRLPARKTGSSRKNLVLIFVEDGLAWLRNLPFYRVNTERSEASTEVAKGQ